MDKTYYLEKISRTDRHEILGNRMSAYSVGLGGGSIAYWDGLWDNDEDWHPYQMRAVYEGTDGELILREFDGTQVVVQRYYHKWRPDIVESNFLSKKRVVVKERKGICDDVFVSRIEFSNLLMKPYTLLLCREGLLPKKTKADILPGGILHLFSSEGLLKNVHRLIVLGPGKSDTHLTKNDFTMRLTIAMKGNVGKTTPSLLTHLIVAMGMDLQETLRRLKSVIRNPDAALEKRRDEWASFFNKNVPKFHSCDSLVEKFFFHSFYVAKGNILDFQGEESFTEPYTCPSKLRLLPQWFWDMGFQAVHEKWTHGYPFPKSCIRNCLNAQKKDGHLIFMHYKKGDGDFLDHLGYHQLIQPFILPMSIWDIYLKDSDRSFLKECLPKLAAFDRWMQRERDPRKEWLVNLQIPGESGWDNSKRFVPEGLPLTPDKCGINALPIQPVDFNTYVYIGRALIRRIAEEIGNKALAEEYAEIQKHTAKAISRMFDPKLGMYADKFIGENRLSKIKSAGGLIPLLSGLATKAQAKSVVRHLLNPAEFWSRYPVPSLSMDDFDFTCADEYQSYWNGRTWANVDWLILEGLMRAGETDAAAQLLDKLVQLGNILGEPYMTENFHPLKPYCYDINQNTICYGWTGLITDAIIRRGLGIQPNMPKGEIIFNPLMPSHWHYSTISDLRIGRHQLEIQLFDGGKNGYSAVIKQKGPDLLKVRYSPDEIMTVHNNAREIQVKQWRSPHWLDL